MVKSVWTGKASTQPFRQVKRLAQNTSNVTRSSKEQHTSNNCEPLTGHRGFEHRLKRASRQTTLFYLARFGEKPLVCGILSKKQNPLFYTLHKSM